MTMDGVLHQMSTSAERSESGQGGVKPRAKGPAMKHGARGMKRPTQGKACWSKYLREKTCNARGNA